jgi:hypothetical protein
MSEQSPYEQLGVNEDASFDEIQDARNRLIAQCGDDRKRVESLEAAYDAVLMHRLRLRQEGKIKVPDRIRFAERSAEENPKQPLAAPPLQPTLPGWMEQLVDTPSPEDILWPAVVFGVLGAGVLSLPLEASLLQLILLGSIGTCIYFLHRKERRLGRSVLLSFVALIVGFFVGYFLYLPLKGWLGSVGIAETEFSTSVTLVVFWLICSFLR